MFKTLTALLICLLMPLESSFAQTISFKHKKIYSGYLHEYNLKIKKPFWKAIFSPTFPKQEEIAYDMQSFVEFRSPVSFAHQPVTEIPRELTYTIRFSNSEEFSRDFAINERIAFEKPLIKIYTDDDQEYTIDPSEEGKQLHSAQEHHITDTYLVYLILGGGINHIEVVSTMAHVHDKYILDQLEIKGGHEKN